MISLIELLHPYPIQENLVAVLPLGDLLNLSKTNSTIRALLHGFSYGSMTKPHLLETVRPALSIGRHDTLYWKTLKIKSPLCCSEPQHTKGDKVKGCRMCSMPVCEACVFKASFGKRDEKTFPNRTRLLCVHCFDSGNPHQETSLNGEGKVDQTPYLMRTECICIAKDGHLCMNCKKKQNHEIDSKDEQCVGIGCSKPKSDGFGGRVCLWCGLPLPRERSRAESRRDYDLRHLLARRHSSYNQLSEEKKIIDFADQEADRASSPFTSSASERTSSLKKEKVVAYDRFEDARIRVLERVSERRQHLTFAAEERRWHRCETLRRPESVCRASPPTRILGKELSFAAQRPTGTPSGSIELTPNLESGSSPLCNRVMKIMMPYVKFTVRG